MVPTTTKLLTPSPTFDGNGIVGLDFRTPRYWRAFLAIAGREQKAAEWLKDARVAVYWPNYAVSQAVGALPNGRHTRALRLRALIPGFLFVPVAQSVEINLHAVVEQVPALYGYMRDGVGNAAAVSESDIHCIRRIEAEENTPAPAKHVHNFKIGQKVRFKQATTWVGKILEFCNDGRISVGVPMLGQIAPVKGLPHQIEAV